jgi:hypothetical protein
MDVTWLRGVVAILLLAAAMGVAGRKLLLVYRLIRLGGGPVPLTPAAPRLRGFVTRVLAEADAGGFTIDEVIGALRAYRQQGG